MRIVHDDWLLTPYRAAVHLPTATAVAADLHLGYARARGRRGDAVPCPLLAEELADLRALAERCDVRRLVVAGDLTHAGMNAELLEEFGAWLQTVPMEVVAWVPGNHDRRPGPCAIFPTCAVMHTLGAWQIVHGDEALPPGKCVFGHVHPCLSWRGAKAPCYLVGKDHLILPAYSRDAAGVNVCQDRRWEEYRCCAIVGENVLDYGCVGMLARGRERQRPDAG